MPDLTPEKHQRRGGAADPLWRELAGDRIHIVMPLELQGFAARRLSAPERSTLRAGTKRGRQRSDTSASVISLACGRDNRPTIEPGIGKVRPANPEKSSGKIRG